jgi:hypothetical protein
MDIDRQRIAAAQALEALGYGYHGGEWVPPAAPRSRGGTPERLTQ